MTSSKAPYIPPPPAAETTQERLDKLQKAKAARVRMLQQANTLDQAFYSSNTGLKL